MKRLLFALLLLPSLAFAADTGSITVTPSVANPNGRGGLVMNYTLAVTSDDDTEGVAGTAITKTVALHGYIVQVTTDPVSPTAAWDCQLLGPLGGDVLGGALANRSASATELAYSLDALGATVFARVDGTYTLSCTNMGANENATIVLSVQE